MNRFVAHHRDAIAFSYSCFDRILCRGYIQRLQTAAAVAYFLKQRRNLAASPACLKSLASDYRQWLEQEAARLRVAIVEPNRDCRREDLVQPYFQQLGRTPGLAVILKCREPERIAFCYQNGHIELERRFINVYYFYLNDAQLGRIFVRICPYLPYNIGVYFNGHDWLARRLQQEGIVVRQQDNVFLHCDKPERLQELSDAFAATDITPSIAAVLTRWCPRFSEQERADGFRHRLFLSQVEYCHNIRFHNKRFAEKLFDRLMDASRSIGHPDKLAVIFGRSSFHPDTRTGQVNVRVSRLRTPIISTSFRGVAIKQYVKAPPMRTETSVFCMHDLRLKKGIDNLPRVREVLASCNERYLNAQQDILETYVDTEQLQQLRQATVSETGRRTPGMRLDDPRLLALLQALCCFIHLTRQGQFRTADLLADVRQALHNPDYKLSQLRYDLNKLRGKGLVVRLKGTQCYELMPNTYRLAVLYLKLYHRLYAPLTAGILQPAANDNEMLSRRTEQLDQLYQAVDKALANLMKHAGLAA